MQNQLEQILDTLKDRLSNILGLNEVRRKKVLGKEEDGIINLSMQEGDSQGFYLEYDCLDYDGKILVYTYNSDQDAIISGNMLLEKQGYDALHIFPSLRPIFGDIENTEVQYIDEHSLETIRNKPSRGTVNFVLVNKDPRTVSAVIFSLFDLLLNEHLNNEKLKYIPKASLENV